MTALQAGSHAEAEHFDVVIVGAGISGIGAAYHLRQRCPTRSFVVLEAMETFGGTWWTHRYPGVRSDSDLFTFGFRFKPWKGAPLASGKAIRDYLGEVIEENGLEAYIRYRRSVECASWSTAEREWALAVRHDDTGERSVVTASFLWMCQGYYRHGEGYTPEWEGLDRFGGVVVHPQRWPEDLSYAGKTVAVVGSGSTAATLIPALAPEAAHITMVQRSPTFFYVRPRLDELAEQLRELAVPDEWVHEILRRKYVHELRAAAQMSSEYPDEVRQFLLDSIRPLLPEGFDVDRHFNPPYRPWQQRIAVVPEGDLFTAIRDGKVSVVTGRTDRFTERGILMTSGEEIEADIVITATGFTMSVLGDVEFDVDGERVDFSAAVTYRGIMFTGVPNLATVFGYLRYSWTLRADLVSDFVCTLLQHLDELGATVVVPELRAEESGMPLGPWVDPENFNPGYLLRALERMPRQGDHDPWRLQHDYVLERELLATADLDDGTLKFT